MIHAKAVKPRIFPWNNDVAPAQIDRAQNLSGDITLNRDKLYEIGRDGVLGYKKQTPSMRYSMTQFEYGELAFWKKLANMVDGETVVTLEDLKTQYFDISAYLTDDNSTFRGSILFPRLRVNGINLNIGSPDANIERSFDLVGEDYLIFTGRYFSYQKAVAVAPGDLVAVLDPVAIEYETGIYLYRVLRVRAGLVSELEYGSGTNQYEYVNGTATITVHDCLTDDIVKVYYPSATEYDTLWTNNDIDAAALTAQMVDIEMKVGTSEKIYRLQSVAIATAFERADFKEIGNANIVQTGVKSKTVTITLGRLLEDFTIEEVLAGDPVLPFINPRNFVDNIQLRIKVYSDSTKTSFKIGYLMTNLSPTSLGTAQAIEDYNNATNEIQGDNIKISDDVDELDFI
jgi:hypothetical protein